MADMIPVLCSSSHSLNLARPCDLLWPIECDGSDTVPTGRETHGLVTPTDPGESQPTARLLSEAAGDQPAQRSAQPAEVPSTPTAELSPNCEPAEVRAQEMAGVTNCLCFGMIYYTAKAN